jgi:hypothetical protein
MATKQTEAARAGTEAANSIKWRARQIYGDATSADARRMIVASTAWALSHFRYTAGFERALLAGLDLKWHDADNGARALTWAGG